MMNRHVPVTLVSVFRTVTNGVRYRRQRYAFSFVRDAAALRWAAVAAEGSQFGLVTCFRKRQLLLLWSTRCCS